MMKAHKPCLQHNRLQRPCWRASHLGLAKYTVLQVSAGGADDATPGYGHVARDDGDGGCRSVTFVYNCATSCIFPPRASRRARDARR